MPSRRQRAVVAQASRMTNSPIARIAPLASASGMNCAGETIPRPGDDQRRSASTPTTVSPSMATYG